MKDDSNCCVHKRYVKPAKFTPKHSALFRTESFEFLSFSFLSRKPQDMYHLT